MIRALTLYLGYSLIFSILSLAERVQAQETCASWQTFYQGCLSSETNDRLGPVACELRANEACGPRHDLSGGDTFNVFGSDGYTSTSGDTSTGVSDGDGAVTRTGASAPTGEESTTSSKTTNNSTKPGNSTRSVSSANIDSLESSLAQCKASLKQTATCCNDPMSCLTGDGSRDTSGAMMALQVVAGSATSMASISGSCGTLGTVSTAMAAINAGLAFKCSQKISQCNSACGSVAKRAESMIPQYSNPDVSECDQYSSYADKSSCRRGIEDTAGRQLARLEKIVSDADQCDNYGGQAVQQQQQAIASLYAAKVAGLCKKAANTETAKSNNAFDVNCSDPTNAANPICQNQCNRANAASDPMCAQLLGLGTTGYGSGSGSGLVDPNALGSKGSGSIDEFEDAQGMNDPNIMASANKANVSSGGGGGGVPSGASSGGGDAGAAGGGGEGGGLNTDIMGGASSRSGYTNPYVRSSLGGGGGYSAGGGRVPASAAGKPFNPRDFLPGGKMDPKRKLAGLAAATPEIGAVHGNIFTNITNRFLQVCLRDGLFDCESVRKNAKPRN